MSKLSTMKEAGRLRLSSQLQPTKRNLTRWTSTIEIFQRFEKLYPSIDESNPQIVDFIPTATFRNNIRRQIPVLQDLKSVTIAHESENLTLVESELLLKSIMDDFAHFDVGSFLSNEARIVYNPVFERVILKIQNGREKELDNDERISV
ncbi:hypothetical protein AeNC1_017697, partial [Aphanomyces euteiches]